MSLPRAARTALEDGLASAVFPAAAIEVGSSAEILASEAFGRLTFEPADPHTRPDTMFDLASLTKVIATTTVLMDLVRSGTVRLDEPLSAFFSEWRGRDREAVSVRDALEHTAGLPARLLDPPPRGRREFEHDICATALEYGPRSRSVYSDLGFILLGFLAADRGGAALDELFDRSAIRPNAAALTFHVAAESRGLAAPTRPMDEDPRRGRVFAGEVHDNYAAALGGVAGHAGLFGSAAGVGVFARAILGAARAAEPLVSLFTARTLVPGSSRALGWDTMLPTSSCGTRMSPAAFGHVGYTGTSLWIDPGRDRYFVLLTNRVFGGGTLEEIRTVRRAFHDALADV